MDELSVYDYATSVYSVLTVPNQLFGIGTIPAMFILVFTIILINIVSIYCAIIGVVLFFVSRIICKKDPYTLTILFERLMMPDLWRKD